MIRQEKIKAQCDGVLHVLKWVCKEEKEYSYMKEGNPCLLLV